MCLLRLFFSVWTYKEYDISKSERHFRRIVGLQQAVLFSSPWIGVYTHTPDPSSSYPSYPMQIKHSLMVL
jgi:hypothetical protein